MEERQVTGRKLKDVRLMLAGAFQGTGFFYAGILFLIVFSALGQVAEPIAYGLIIDRVVAQVGAGDVADLWQKVFGFVIIWATASLLGSASRELSQWLSQVVGNKVWAAFSLSALKTVLDWDPERFGRTSLGALAKRLERAGEASWDLAARTVVDILPTIITFIVFLIVGLVLDWRMVFISLATVPFLLIMSLGIYRLADKKQEALNESWEQVSRKLYEIIVNVIPVKSYVAEERMVREYSSLIKSSLSNQSRLIGLWTVLDFLNAVIRFAGRLIVLTAGLYFISSGQITLGTLVTFLGFIGNLLAPFDYLLTDILRRTTQVRSAFSRLSVDWYSEKKLLDISRAQPLKKAQGDVVFDQVYYRYPEGRTDVLSNISLTIKADSSLAIVGPSGGGKSTLIKFVNRFLDPTKGTVSIDGVDVRQIKIKDLRKAVGVVHQDTVMFNESIYENIRFAKPDATKEEIISAAKKAQAHEFIERLGDGYETMVGERGVRLSGGERQRLALARVFLADPPILILDESTSALDSETEAKLQSALKSVMKGRTTIIIAHRLSTVYMAEQIAVIERGKLVELGTHNQLLSEGGLYKKLWQLQSGGYLPD